MSAPVIKGWCPGALRPMDSGDGLVVRIRAHGGRLTAAQTAGVADLAARHGNARIDLSARANLQLRGVTAASHGPLIAGLAALGLIDDSPAAEARRNILVTPFRGDDATPTLVAGLEAALADAPVLPGKFGFALDIGRRPVLTQASADIRLERDRTGALILRPDGHGFGRPVTQDEAPAAMIALARWFVDSGGVSGGRGRMAAHLARGAVLPPGFDRPGQEGAAPPGPGACDAGFLLALAFGQTDAETLARLAALGRPLRLTPWRMLLVEGVTSDPQIPGLIADPADPILRVIACTGAPACPQGLQPTRPLARALAPHVASLHVSGCAKGCAHPGPAPLTLTATPHGFALIRNGRAGDVPARHLTLDALKDPHALDL